MKRTEVEQRAIFIGLAGSHGYGLNRPESDYDYRGVFIAPKSYYLGFNTIEQKDAGWDEPGLFPFIDGNEDTVIYELRKVTQLLANANPNVLELLWLTNYPFKSEVGQHLIDHRDLFLSKKVKHTYTGYAFAQIKKIETHRKWLLSPPSKQPLPSDFGITNEEPLSKEELNAFLEYLYLLVRGKVEYLEKSEELYKLLTADIDFKGLLKQHPLPDDTLEYTEKLTYGRKDFIRLLQKSQGYHNALREWNAYLSWQKNRNPARAGMERLAGYDLKHGMHCIRLLKGGVEILQGKGVLVDRNLAGDAAELKAILKGDYSYEELKQLSEDLLAQMIVVYEQSTLPHHPNQNKINDLCMELVEMQGW
ncbi:MAG: nucleotidyltransferase [Anabaena sp. MDT14b]|jgi:predicted nucleotidyltransferase|uniref:Nucleotidyltransferase n=1 Tax=Aphanizomenon flos-aquae WA102 TaxID=1710896 RepID=A0A1B7X2N7_APHFL|nr:MAG: nucleotidyltransferase [Anabaena sp. MDT14b]OBQ43609.1 MAG: nucleotidyltransferase [Aphanizomenon flos-aquae WA102]